ncbi:MAG: D-tyrosyl-tRNA(Tyr) deacylase [Oscillospiraceae bacterium]|nr:D-tyrosyl-tRNA(Tyr) deacylase [Oscillospiraceae bacterium]
MRAVVSRVSSASVAVEGRIVGEIGKGFLVLLGIHREDTPAQADKLADRLCGLRVFADENGKMNRNLKDAGGSVLIVSQFTLYADTRSRRPGFTEAARPEAAVPLYEQVAARCRERGFAVETGVFGADMAVSSVGDGPVTILLEV